MLWQHHGGNLLRQVSYIGTNEQATSFRFRVDSYCFDSLCRLARVSPLRQTKHQRHGDLASSRDRRPVDGSFPDLVDIIDPSDLFSRLPVNCDLHFRLVLLAVGNLGDLKREGERR